jgi:hypothetical protein
MYCIHCHKSVEATDKCPHCGEPLKQELTGEEKTNLVQALHKEENLRHDKLDRGMSFLVVGAIFIVIGIIFFTLSFKLDPTNQSDSHRYLRFASSEFVVAMAGLVGGGSSFLYGVITAIREERHLRVLKHDIDEINKSNTALTDKTPLWLPEFIEDSKAKIENHREVKAALKNKSK